ncbi:hypothetical protein A2U01_0060758, partial [Trifolium medium]|nr:hypothetical protein [Trifolium medium]
MLGAVSSRTTNFQFLQLRQAQPSPRWAHAPANKPVFCIIQFQGKSQQSPPCLLIDGGANFPSTTVLLHKITPPLFGPRNLPLRTPENCLPPIALGFLGQS